MAEASLVAHMLPLLMATYLVALLQGDEMKLGESHSLACLMHDVVVVMLCPKSGFGLYWVAAHPTGPVACKFPLVGKLVGSGDSLY